MSKPEPEIESCKQLAILDAYVKYGFSLTFSCDPETCKLQVRHEDRDIEMNVLSYDGIEGLLDKIDGMFIRLV